MKILKRLALFLLICYGFTGLAGAVEAIDVQAKAALLADPQSGDILYQKNELEKCYPASITKLMTALLVVEQGKDTGTVTASETAMEGLSEAGSTQDIRPGEVMEAGDLLVCLLVASANEAANILAEYTAGSVDKFVEMMNNRAQELGCKNTHFTNTHGLHDENHYTCAYDVFLIAREAMKHERIAEIVAMPKATVPKTNLSDERTFFSTNSLLSPYKTREYLYDPVTGIKTGHTTPAGMCLAASAEKGGVEFISVVLGASKDEETGKQGHFVETEKLLEWGFDNFESQTILTPAAPVAELKVRLAWDRDYVAAIPAGDVVKLVPNDYDPEKLTLTPELPESMDAPIEKGAALGRARLTYDGQDYGTVELVAADTVERSNLLYGWDLVKRFFGMKITKIVLGFVVLLIIIYILFVISYNRRRSKRRRQSYRGYRGKKR